MKAPGFDRLATLMQDALQGDASAYDSALREILPIVRAYARARLGATLADDVAQEILISVHRARHTYDPGRPFAPWLLAIAHSRVIDCIRRQRHRSRNEQQLARDPGDDAGRGRERMLSVAQALRRLPDRQRRVIELLKLEGWSAREVATALGLSVSNVKVIAHRGYAALRRTLKDEP